MYKSVILDLQYTYLCLMTQIVFVCVCAFTDTKLVGNIFSILNNNHFNVVTRVNETFLQFNKIHTHIRTHTHKIITHLYAHAGTYKYLLTIKIQNDHYTHYVRGDSTECKYTYIYLLQARIIYLLMYYVHFECYLFHHYSQYF